MHSACAVVMPRYLCNSYYNTTAVFNNSCSFCEEGQSNELMHIAANDDTEPAYDLYEKFQAACDFISKLDVLLTLFQWTVSIGNSAFVK